MKQLPLFFLTDVYRRGKGGAFRKWSHGVMSATVPLEQMVGALRTAGAGVIVCGYWKSHGEEMKPGINCLSAGDSGELAGIIARKRDAAEWLALNRGAGETMQQHAPRLIAPQFLKALT